MLHCLRRCVWLIRQRKGILNTEAGEAPLHYARSLLCEVTRLEGELAD